MIPVRSAHGSEGIPLKGGSTLPFRVRRTWSAPAGLYFERFYLVDPGTREVLFEGPLREERIWGLQSLTELVDEVREPIELAAGTYEMVFSLGGTLGGTVTVEAFDVSDEQAA